MSENEPAEDRVDRLRAQLDGNKAQQGAALRELASVEDDDWTLITELTPDLIPYIATANALQAERAAKALQTFATNEPDAVSKGIREAEDILPESTDAAAESVLDSLLLAEEASPGTLAPGDIDLQRFLEARSDDVRRDAARLLGYMATAECIDRLHTLVEQRSADSAIIEGAEEGFEEAANRIAASFESNGAGPLTLETAAEALERLVAVRPSLVENNWKRILTGLSTNVHADVADAIISLVEGKTGEAQEDFAETITGRVLELIADHTQSATTVAVGLCEQSSRASELVASELEAPPEAPLDTDGSEYDALVANLVDNRLQPVAKNVLDTLIETNKVDLDEIVNPLIQLLGHPTAGRPAVSILGRAAIRQPKTATRIFEDWLGDHLFDLCRSESQGRAQHTMLVLGYFARSNPDVAEKIVDTTTRSGFAQEEHLQSPVRFVLENAATHVPAAIRAQAEGVIPLLDSSNPTVRMKILSMLGEIFDEDTSIPSPVLKRMIGALGDPEIEVQSTAMQAISDTDMYPAPPSLHTLAEDDEISDEISRRASQAIDVIEQQRRSAAISTTDIVREGVEVSNDETGGFELRRWSETDGWTSVSLGTLRSQLLERLREEQSRKRSTNIPVLTPYYAPAEVVLFTIDTVLQHLGTDYQAVLFSPGTQTQWGTKAEVRQELSKFGIARPDTPNHRSVPITDILEHAYIYDGEVKSKIRAQTNDRIIITKSLDEILALESGDVDSLVMNLAARTHGDWTDELNRIDDQFDDTSSLTFYSHFTKNQVERGRPRYGPPAFLSSVSTQPEIDIFDAVLAESSKGDQSESTTSLEGSVDGNRFQSEVEALIDDGIEEDPGWVLGDDDVVARTESPRIQFSEIAAPNIDSLLEQVFEASSELEDVEDEGGAHKIFSEQMFYERLPVPVRHHDGWIREQRNEGVYMLPDVSGARLANLEAFGEHVENMQVPKRVFDSEKRLQRIRNELESQNPMFDAITNRLQDAHEEGSDAAVLVPTPSWKGMLERALRAETQLGEHLDEGRLAVLTPDTARTVDSLARLVIPGPLHPQHKSYYVHPRADIVEVLTYNRLWAGMVERQATEAVKLLNATTAGPDFSPYAEPVVEGDIEPVVEETEPEADKAKAVKDRSSNGRTAGMDARRNRMDSLARTMEAVSDSEYEESKSRYDHEYRAFEIGVDDGEELHLSNAEKVLRRRPSSVGSEDPYHWASPEILSRGDTIVIVPPDVELELWRDRLHELYSGDIPPTAVEDLEIWHTTLNEIWSEVEARLGNPSENDVLDAIFRDCQKAGMERGEETVAQWFKSVHDADYPVELAADPTLRIGPQAADDIRIIGEAFGRAELAENFESIEQAMRGFRTVNRNEGRKFQNWLKSQYLAEGDNRVKSGAREYSVQRVTDITEHTEEGRSS